MLMMRSALAMGLMITIISTAASQDYSVEIVDEPAKAEGLAAELLQQFSSKGYRAKRGSRTICELWLCKQWNIEAEFEATPERLYPFHPGQLIALVHFPRKTTDFRQQTITDGWYTLRFELQPVDGNHVGTSVTRDFLLAVAAEHDAADKDWDAKDLQAVSAEAAGASHPAMLCLQTAGASAEPAMSHLEEQDWWVMHVLGQATEGGKQRALPLDIVIAGHAAE